MEALDPLAARLLDEREDAGLRVVILDSLLTLQPPLAPAHPPAAAGATRLLVRARAGRPRRTAGRARTPRSGDRLVDELLSPTDRPPEAAAERATAALARRGAPAIPALQRALERLGPLRRGRTDPASLRARAAIHEALAALDSRVALYDLRETIEARPRAVMPALLRAASRIGDASVVPALARVVAEDTALLDGCADALAAIVARERLRRTSAALKAVRPEHRTAFDLLWERAKAARPG